VVLYIEFEVTGLMEKTEDAVWGVLSADAPMVERPT
jgi:hypothetical protein